jgi:hypothetical protein
MLEGKTGVVPDSMTNPFVPERERLPVGFSSGVCANTAVEKLRIKANKETRTMIRFMVDILSFFVDAR